jgi:hypothetical protein
MSTTPSQLYGAGTMVRIGHQKCSTVIAISASSR